MPEQEYSSSICSDASFAQSEFVPDIAAAVGVDADEADVGQLTNLIDYMNAGAFLANASTAINLAEAKSVLIAMDKQLQTDFNASRPAFAGLADSINFTSVGQILSTIAQQDIGTTVNELYDAVDSTGVGYFLGNITMSFDQSQFGNLLSQLLQTVNFTQVAVVIEAIPSMFTDLPMAGTVIGQIVGNANLTQAGDVLNGYIDSYGTLLQGCY